MRKWKLNSVLEGSVYLHDPSVTNVMSEKSDCSGTGNAAWPIYSLT